MRTARFVSAVLALAGSCLLSGCGEDRPARPEPATKPASPTAAPAAAAAWSAEKLTVVEGLNAPESVLVEPATGVAYVANIETDRGQYWGEDGTGFVSRLKPGGEVDLLRWAQSTPQLPLHCPKGMCIFGGSLYVANNTHLVRLAIDAPAGTGTVTGVRGKMLNDVATDGAAVYVSDTGAGVIYKTDGHGTVEQLRAPETVNGITFHKGKMYAVSWGRHDVYEVDPAGAKPPVPFGLSQHFKSLDGIEVLDDGSFVVTDNIAGKVCIISPDRRTVRAIADAREAADIGLDRRRSLLYVPQIGLNQVTVYRLAKK